MRRVSNVSAKPFEPFPMTRRASFSGGYEAPDLATFLQNDVVLFEQQQQQAIQQMNKKSPRKVTLNPNAASLIPSTVNSIGNKLFVNSKQFIANTGVSANNLSQQDAADQQQNTNSSGNALPSNLYKTELCRSFEETGSCRYGSKCQFAHGFNELRPAPRHPKYKTEICKTFHSIGTCPYGTRCRFIHTTPNDNVDWITADVDNPLFAIPTKEVSETERSPNTASPFLSSVNIRNQTVEPIAMIRAEVPPRSLDMSRVERNTTNIMNLTPKNNGSDITSGTNNILNPLGRNLNLPSLNGKSTSYDFNSTALITKSTLNVNSSVLNANSPSFDINFSAFSNNSVNSASLATRPANAHINSSAFNANFAININPTAVNVNSVPVVSPANNLLSAHHHRLPVFRELCHQNSAERLQQQMLDFVFEKEQ